MGDPLFLCLPPDVDNDVAVRLGQLAPAAGALVHAADEARALGVGHEGGPALEVFGPRGAKSEPRRFELERGQLHARILRVP